MTTAVKAIVHCRAIVDGKVNREWDEQRMVYLFDSGPCVSHLGRKRGRSATANPDGTYSVDYVARSIPITTFDKISVLENGKRNGDIT